MNLLDRYRQLYAGWRRVIVASLLTGLLVLLGAAALPAVEHLGIPVEKLPFYSLPFGDNPFAPGEWKTPDGNLVNWRGVPSARACAGCHRKEFMEWNTSLHAVSDLDLIYDAAVTRNAGRAHAAAGIGDQKGRWCESCHNPLGTLTGAVNPIMAIQETEAIEEGVNCIVCHTAIHPEPLAGNGALTSRINETFRHLDPALIMAAPSRHARDMQARRDFPHMGESGLCGACHTEIRPTEVGGQHPLHFQETFDEWRKSPYAEAGVQCQDCHMASDPAAYIGALKRGETPERGVAHRFIGGNYLLTDPELPNNLMTDLRAGAPTGVNRFFTRDEYAREMKTTHSQVVGLLRAAADMAVDARSENGALQLDVAVTNSGAGHALPTGPLDQRHMWIELIVENPQGERVFHSGAFDDTNGRIDPDAVMWVKHMIDHEGQLDLRHTLFDIDRLVYPRKPIAAGKTEQVRYTVPLQADAGPYTVRARLWYRIAFQEILDNIKDEGMGDFSAVIIPPLLLTEASTTVTPLQLAQGGAR